jgi:pyruvate carboxylase
MQPGEETIVNIGEGKDIIVSMLSIGEPDEYGMRTVFFRLNGQTRNIDVKDKSLNIKKIGNPKADKLNPGHVGAPLQGLLSKIFVKPGQTIAKNQPMFVIEAMKMETTITAPSEVKIHALHLKDGTLVNADDLVLTVE